MNNLYNAKVSFNGEGSFTFTLPKYGELTIYNGRDIFIKGLDVNGVEILRQLRPLLLNHILNAKPDGCFKVIDLTDSNISNFQNSYNISKKEVMSVADLKANLVKSNGPIIEEVEVHTVSETDEILPNKDDVNKVGLTNSKVDKKQVKSKTVRSKKIIKRK